MSTKNTLNVLNLRYLRYLYLFTPLLLTANLAHGELEPLAEQEMREATGGTALQYSSTNISYQLRQLTGVNYDKRLLGLLGSDREETYTATEQVDATVHRVQINGSGELHAYAEEFTLGDYNGSNNSIYKTADGQGVPDIALRDFGFGNSAEDPFYFEDPYIEIQKQRHADGSETLRGIRFGFGKAEGPAPVAIDSASGYIQARTVLPEVGGLILSQLYGSGTRDTFVTVASGEPPDGTGNYPQTPAPGFGTPNNVAGPLDSLADPVDGLIGSITGLIGIDTPVQAPGGKEVNLSHLESLNFDNVQNFYISMTQGGGNSFVNDDGSINGAKWSQHLNGVIPGNRPDLPGFNLGAPFNDPDNPAAGGLTANPNTVPALTQILLGVGDDNPRQNYERRF